MTAAAFLALLGLAVIAGCRYLARVFEETRTNLRKIHAQQANIIGMLLRAGFRPARGGLDWLDDGDKTQLPSFTRFDWRTPEERHRR